MLNRWRVRRGISDRDAFFEVKAYRDRANAYQGKAEQLKTASELPKHRSNRRSSHDQVETPARALIRA